jgi:hypothetical protein
MKFGNLDINPQLSPGMLDTETWDREAACRQVRALEPELSQACGQGGTAACGTAAGGRLVPVRDAFVREIAREAGSACFLLALPDGQKVFLRAGKAPDPRLGEPLMRVSSSAGLQADVLPTDAPVIDSVCTRLRPGNAPRGLGRTPRIGIGCRMTTRVWAGAFDAMAAARFAANSIQNSVRELNLLSDMKAGRAPERNYASGFGMIEPGYTGSSFEGLWVSGVLAALMREERLAYGADADHIQIKRSDEGLAKALRVVEAARYYSFFTLDMADVLAYDSLGGDGAGFLDRLLPDEAARRETLSLHGEPFTAGSRTWRLTPEMIGRFVGKYWRALDAVAPLARRIQELKAGEPFDLEFAFDEHPPEIRGPDCISFDEEVIFVARELARRGLPVTHIAPNFGVEKGQDYRLADGYAGLQARIGPIFDIAEQSGLMLDFHSADDLTEPARRAIRAATGGRMHYKISPSLHAIFARTVFDHEPDLFLGWWKDALSYAETEAAGGSAVAARCLKALAAEPDRSPSPSHEVFREFFFAYPGRRDASGRFANRERMYSLPQSLYDDYRRRVDANLRMLAGDLFAS